MLNTLCNRRLPNTYGTLTYQSSWQCGVERVSLIGGYLLYYSGVNLYQEQRAESTCMTVKYECAHFLTGYVILTQANLPPFQPCKDDVIRASVVVLCGNSSR